jgi:metal-dependent amidase/aminoacylase/carboxypeptidase family protein
MKEKRIIDRIIGTASAVYNDQVLTRHLAGTLEGALGKRNVVVLDPVMGAEDYSVFVEQGVPSFFFRLGVADPDALARARASHKELPSVHSPLFAPVAGPALRTGIMAEVALLRDLLKGNDVDLSRITERKQGGR